jgi:hypothetical protein
MPHVLLNTYGAVGYADIILRYLIDFCEVPLREISDSVTILRNSQRRATEKIKCLFITSLSYLVKRPILAFRQVQILFRDLEACCSKYLKSPILPTQFHHLEK